MTVPFNNIPSTLRIPLFFAEIDPRYANTASAVQRTLLIGQITSAGSYVANVPIRVASVGDNTDRSGNGSILDGMVQAYRKNDPSGEVWALPIADNGGATAATGSIALTGTATAAGTFPLYVAGVLIPVAVAVGDTATAVGANIAAAVNAAVGVPVTAAAVTGTVTFTARNKGLAGNDIDIRTAYRGSSGGEVIPAGLAAVVTAMSGGATNPSLTTAIAALGDMRFDFIVCSLTDSATIAALAALLSDVNGRWSPTAQIFGHAFIAQRGTAGALASAASGYNNQHISVIGFNDSPSPTWAWAAAFAGAAAVSLRNDPALPLQYVVVQGLLAPPVSSRFTSAVRNATLLYGGVSTWLADHAGAIFIENMITTYVTNAQGNADNSYLEIETLFTLVYVLRFMRTRVQTKYSRVKLAADGVRILPGSPVVTPKIIKSDVIAAYRELEEGGFVQNSDAFAANVVVEKDAGNPNRVNVLWPGTLINQLRVFAMLAQFRLS